MLCVARMVLERHGNVKEVRYSMEHWNLLNIKRRKGLELMEVLYRCGIQSMIIHGSVARGDVNTDSDIDIALLYPYSPSLVELCLERNGFTIYSLAIVQPTPLHTPKIYLVLDPNEERIITIPLVDLKSIEIEFYRFSGMLSLNELRNGKRVPGVNKRLILIDPRPWGHVEIPVLGNEGYIARRLGVSINVVLDRVRALTRREEEGHTGLFIEIEVPQNMSIEQLIEWLCKNNRLFRQRVMKHGLCT